MDDLSIIGSPEKLFYFIFGRCGKKIMIATMVNGLWAASTDGESFERRDGVDADNATATSPIFHYEGGADDKDIFRAPVMIRIFSGHQ